ncbi:MAG TPA: MFS transporter [Acidimicrobiales bacterium]|nr:MFS transporter [Acidimicrobiales bacterium]
MRVAPPGSPAVSGTARAALAHRNFRIVFWGSFASRLGTWMQHVTLGAYALELTGSATFLSLILFAQLGPMLFLPVLGGALADLVDRRRLLIAAQAEQLLGTAVLAVLVAGGEPSQGALLAVVGVIGVGAAIHAPAYDAVLPALVGRADLAGAVSLNSTQMNLARVTGPALGGLVFAGFGAAAVFALNAITYLFVIAALVAVRIPPLVRADENGRWARLSGGFGVARRDPLVRRCLVTMAAFALFCMPFIGQMPTLASRNLGIEPSSVAYGLLYTCFGLGAAVGAGSIGTFLAARPKEQLVRVGLVAFAGALAVLALLRSPLPAYPVILVVGFCYFGTVTSLAVVLQQRLDDAVRGRVMALWTMAFGGTIPLGLLAAGPLVETFSISWVMGYGVVAALALAAYANLPRVAAAPVSRRPSTVPPDVPAPPPGCP